MAEDGSSVVEFQDWPRVETSAVHTASLRNTIQSDYVHDAVKSVAAFSAIPVTDTMTVSSKGDRYTRGQQNEPKNTEGQLGKQQEFFPEMPKKSKRERDRER